MQKTIFSLFLFLSCSLFGKEYLQGPTYFTYSKEQLNELKSLESPYKMNLEQLKEWDSIPQKHFIANPHYLQEVRFYTYLYMAQAEAAKLSYQAFGEARGSLGPISREVIQLFLPNVQIATTLIFDPLSEHLSKMVLPKLTARKEKEDESKEIFQIPNSHKEYYTVGLNVSKWSPWVAIPPEKYWPQEPPKDGDEQWKREVSTIKENQSPMTYKKKEAINFWSGLAGPSTGDWRVIANDFLFQHQIPFPKTIMVREVLNVGIYDGCIASFRAKYHYMVERPSRRDPSIKTEIDIPGHPSYPSNHSYCSKVSDVILTHYFPEEKQNWRDLCEEAGMSRIWAGIHYPIDHLEGKKAGERLGQKVLQELDP